MGYGLFKSTSLKSRREPVYLSPYFILIKYEKNPVYFFTVAGSAKYCGSESKYNLDSNRKCFIFCMADPG